MDKNGPLFCKEMKVRAASYSTVPGILESIIIFSSWKTAQLNFNICLYF